MINVLKAGEFIKFDGAKTFKFIETLGKGGDAETMLFEDETTNMKFAIKKYSPKNLKFLDQHYIRFVDEIKILFKLAHPNIVRVYNYYLYPISKTGYLQMEYVDGVTIDKYDIGWLLGWNEIFINTIKAFEYLEENKILHRDIRPANILIDKNGEVKIIDFGFGKVIEASTDEKASMILNWPVTEMPEEIITQHVYNHQTEIYFVGKLFSKLDLESSMTPFKFNHIVDKMSKVTSAERYQSFSEVLHSVSKDALEEIDFSEEEKIIYSDFADELFNKIEYITNKYEFESNLTSIISGLKEVVRANKMENFIQNNCKLINCFLNGPYGYYARADIKYDIVCKFYSFLCKLNSDKQQIVVDNILNRLITIDIKMEYDDIPF